MTFRYFSSHSIEESEKAYFSIFLLLENKLLLWLLFSEQGDDYREWKSNLSPSAIWQLRRYDHHHYRQTVAHKIEEIRQWKRERNSYFLYQMKKNSFITYDVRGSTKTFIFMQIFLKDRSQYENRFYLKFLGISGVIFYGKHVFVQYLKSGFWENFKF